MSQFRDVNVHYYVIVQFYGDHAGYSFVEVNKKNLHLIRYI